MQYSDTTGDSFDGRSNRKIDITDRYCIICGDKIIRNTKAGTNRISPTQYIKAKFCSKECKGMWQSNNIVGENNPNYKGGKSKCIDCGIELAQRYSHRGTLRCKDCHYKYNTGENNGNWKGGVCSESILQRSSKENKKWRISVFERDDFTCQICGDNRGGNLNAHHIKRWCDYPELRFNIDNGITLCKDCHIIIHKK